MHLSLVSPQQTGNKSQGHTYVECIYSKIDDVLMFVFVTAML